MEWICARMSASGVVTEDTLSIEYTVNEKDVCVMWKSQAEML